MKTFASRLAVTAAASSMAFAPIAAQANTRAGDSSTIYSSSTVSQPGTNVSSEGEDIKGSAGFIIALLAAAAVIGGIIVIIDDDDNQSPGAN